MPKNKNKINKINNNSGANLRVGDLKTISLPAYNHPVFCFKNLHRKFNLAKCTDIEKKYLSELLVDLSNLDWDTIQHRDKYKLGSEKISINSLSTPPTPFVTPDVKDLTVIRRQDKMLIIGLRNQFLFHIIYIDPKLKAYRH